MKVRMLTETNWDNKPLKVGDEIEVSEEVGKRWAKHRIAEEVIKAPTVAELKETAKQLGIEGYNNMNKPQLIEAIARVEAAQKEAAELEEKELNDLHCTAFTLDIESYESMNKEQLIEAIAVVEASANDSQ